MVVPWVIRERVAEAEVVRPLRVHKALENGGFPAAFPTYNQKALTRLYCFVSFVVFECLEQDLVVVGVGGPERADLGKGFHCDIGIQSITRFERRYATLGHEMLAAMKDGAKP